jgi:ketosteroid isomerase-like protein
VIDRRSLTGVDLGGGDVLANLRVIYDQPGSRWQQDVLATRGERLALVLWRWLQSKSEAVLAEVEYLAVVEVDAAGRQTLSSTFDLDDLDAAYAELDARFYAGEAAPHERAASPLRRLTQAIAARDWEQLASVFAPDFAVEDHRPVGTLTALSSDEWVASVRALAEMRPDVALRLDHVLDLRAHVVLSVTTWVGGDADGAFEIPIVVVTEYGAAGIRRWHGYGLDQLDEARAKFAALAASAAPDPLRIPPNAATRAANRWHEAARAGDRAAIEALFAPTLEFEDRRRGLRTSGGREIALANERSIATLKPDWSRTVLGTAGDRLALWRSLVAGTSEGATFAVEFLQMLEVDGDGRVIANVVFDLDDRRAAWRELLDRHARSESGRALPAELHELRRALLDRDLDGMRAALPSDFAVHDHRRNRLWSIEGRDAWVAWMATLFEQSPDAIIAPLHHLAIEAHGNLALGFTAGTLAEGGAFEQVYVSLYHFRGGRLAGLEMFEPEDLERARARFEELRPAPAG